MGKSVGRATVQLPQTSRSETPAITMKRFLEEGMQGIDPAYNSSGRMSKRCQKKFRGVKEQGTTSLLWDRDPPFQ
jgi:hypothetical protein